MSNNKIKPEYLYNVFSAGTQAYDTNSKPKYKDLGQHEKNGWRSLTVFFKDNLFNESLK
jgi:hypothetical protein